VVRKARRHLDNIPQSDLGATTLARALNLPEHVARSSFTESVGVSPRIWLRQWRLDQAHRAMLDPKTARKGVAHVAMEHGFYHLGASRLTTRRHFMSCPSKPSAAYLAELRLWRSELLL
jgi:transcriptional regulator GlxA family with amidase domain